MESSQALEVKQFNYITPEVSIMQLMFISRRISIDLDFGYFNLC